MMKKCAIKVDVQIFEEDIMKSFTKEAEHMLADIAGDSRDLSAL